MWRARVQASPRAAIGLFLLMSCASPAERIGKELQPIPQPNLERVDPAVGEQLRSERERLDRLLEERSEGQELSEALGRMGQLYHAYDLLGPAEACYRRAHDLAPDDSRWLYYLGAVNQRLGRLKQAAGDLQAALALQEDDAAALLRLGNVELARNRPAVARSHFERALEAEPSCTEARFGLGQAAAALGDLEAAVRHFQRAIEEQPQAVRVHYPLAQVLLRLGRTEEARPHLEASAARDVSIGGKASCPDPLNARLGELTTGATAHLTRGRHASFAGRPEVEIAEYRKAVAAAPQDAVARQSLASALYRRGEFEEAARQYLHALRLEPHNAGHHRDLGLCLLQLGAVEEAATSFRAALEIDPTLLAAHLKLGEIELQAGRAQETLRHSQHVLQVDPGHRQARLLRVMALLSLGRHDEGKSELIRTMDSYPPEDPLERLRLASLLLRLGEIEASRQNFEAILALEASPTTKARAHLFIGQIHRLRGEHAEATANFRAALALDATLQEARAALNVR